MAILLKPYNLFEKHAKVDGREYDQDKAYDEIDYAPRIGQECFHLVRGEQLFVSVCQEYYRHRASCHQCKRRQVVFPEELFAQESDGQERVEDDPSDHVC